MVQYNFTNVDVIFPSKGDYNINIIENIIIKFKLFLDNDIMLPDRINILQYIKIHQNLYNNLLYNYNLGMNILNGDPEYYQGQDKDIISKLCREIGMFFNDNYNSYKKKIIKIVSYESYVPIHSYVNDTLDISNLENLYIFRSLILRFLIL